MTVCVSWSKLELLLEVVGGIFMEMMPCLFKGITTAVNHLRVIKAE